MKETRYRFTIQGIALDETTASPFVILHDPENGITIPVQTGPSEASSIIVALEGILPEHRNSHDLLAAMFSMHNFVLQHLEVYRYFDGVYHGRIVYRKGVRRYRQEVSASDGIILCIKFGAPIYFTPQAVRDAAPHRRILDDVSSGAAQLLYLEPSHHSLQLM
jgi:bifunctional DNase/RNase